MRHSTAPLSIGLSFGLAIALAVIPIVGGFGGSAQSREPDRTLRLYFGHTGERGEFTFKRNGRYDRRELERINTFLRDWRQNKPTRMDPTLLDLVWNIYKQSGSKDYIQVVSAYRSSGTNEMLRTRSSGVAKNSQHTLGKAMDFYLPDVPLDRLRAVAMRAQGGGVGYYPRSGSPFVHVDTGSVRAWPRMTRQQLIALFPKGDTLHLPADGKPLPGYERALARNSVSGGATLAYLETEPDDADEANSNGNATGWLNRVFGSRKEVAESVVPPVSPAAQPAAGQPTVLVEIAEEAMEPPLPRARPATNVETAIAALAPPAKPLDIPSMATLAFAPLPRNRPDATDLAASLVAPETGVSPLSVNDDDALVALIARVSRVEPANAIDIGSPDAASAAASAPTNFGAVEASQADQAILAAFAAIEDLPEAANAESIAMIASAPPSAQEEAAKDREQNVLVAFVQSENGIQHPAEPPSPLPVTSEQNTLDRLVATPATYDQEFARLAMPNPVGVPGLFSAPTVAAASELSSGSAPSAFRPVSKDRSANEASFLSKLFASLIQ